MLRTLVLFVTIVITCLAACKSKNCPYGKPTATFAPTMKGVAEHKFQVQEQSALEEARFDNGVLMEFYQSGCEQLSQEFRFLIPLRFEDSVAVKLAATQFGYMAQLQQAANNESRQQVFTQWAGIIRNLGGTYQLGSRQPIGSNTFIMLKKVPADKATILSIEIGQEDDK